MASSSGGVAGCPPSSDSAVAPPNTGAPATSARPAKEALNASHIERRKLKRKYAVKKLEKKLENYSRQIKK